MAATGHVLDGRRAGVQAAPLLGYLVADIQARTVVEPSWPPRSELLAMSGSEGHAVGLVA